MTTPPLFPGFDGLMTLSRREGVDIRPTLLRVLTDLYVQASTHSADEAGQFVELTSRLIDEVDDATRTAVRARLAVYPATPAEIMRKLGLMPAEADQGVPPAAEIPCPPAEPLPAAQPPSEAQMRMNWNPAMQPQDAAQLCEMFWRAGANERASILHSLAETPLKASPRIPEERAVRAIEALQMAAWVADRESFTLELSETLTMPARVTAQMVDDVSGEPLACALKALGMPGRTFEHVLLFLKSEIGTSVNAVYRLSRLYERLSERSALVMLAAWRGSTMAVARAKYRPTLYDDERQRARTAPARATGQPDIPPAVRTGTGGSGS
jgi:hypothetical protein